MIHPPSHSQGNSNRQNNGVVGKTAIPPYQTSIKTSHYSMSVSAVDKPSVACRDKPIVYRIPACPFCQRLEVLLALKGQEGAFTTSLVDITKPRAPELLKKTRGTTALPVLETPSGEIIKESLVILQYLDETIPGGQIRRKDPTEHAIEKMLIAKEGSFTMAGYLFVMNQDIDAREKFESKLLALYRELNEFLMHYSPKGTFLFEDFGLAEVVFTPIFQRFWFLEYFEGFRFPDDDGYRRVTAWKKACEEHPLAQQVSREEIIKIYYDYAKGAGNGALVKGRQFSSFVLHPPPEQRPMPPKDKYTHSASDDELGLLAASGKSHS